MDRFADLGETITHIEVADRPARRRIELLTRGAAVRSNSRPARADRTALVKSARWLIRHPTFIGTATRLQVDLGRLDNLDEIAKLCAGRPVLAVRTAEHAGDRLRSFREWPNPAILTATIARLAHRGDLAGGLFAVALVRHGAGFGWKTPWQDLLIGLRRHPDTDVRDEAYTINKS